MKAPTQSWCRRPRHPGLAPFVSWIFYAEGQPAHRLERIMPSGTAQLLVNLAEDALRTVETTPVRRCGGVGVSGPYTESFVIETAMQRRVAGVAFRPGGAAPFFDAPMGALRGQHVDGVDLWGSFARSARDRLGELSEASVVDELEVILLERVRSFRVDPAVGFATAALEAGTRVSVVRERLGWSAGRFIARFERQVGLTPKRFSRVRRFQRVLSAIESGWEGTWAGLAIEHGYADQAHMIREFRRFASVTPTAYRARGPGQANHLVVA